MKKIITIILALLVLSSLSAAYSPSYTIRTGGSLLSYEKERYYSLASSFDLSLLSYKFKCVTVSIPISVTYVTKSTEKNGLLSPSYFRNEAGVEIQLDNNKIGGSLGFYYGYEDYREQYAILTCLEGRASFLWILDKYITLCVPFTYTYTPAGNEFSLTLGLKIGGEVW